MTIPDQWTLQLRQHLPLFRFAVEDGQGTELYVSGHSGAVVLDTSRRERALAYVGPVAHWLYVPVLRRNGPLWTQVVIWSAALGCVLCLSGLVVGVLRISPWRRFRLQGQRAMSPYTGWLRWHHYAGLLFGAVTFTWTFSGLLSMGPFAVLSDGPATRAHREAWVGQRAAPAAVSVDDIWRAARRLGRELETKELTWISFRGRGYWLGRAASGHRLVAADATGDVFERFPKAEMEAAAAALSGPGGTTFSWLTTYDDYYYDRSGDRPLPVLKIVHADAAASWVYVDPGSGGVVHAVGRRDRATRWLYHGLHSLDVAWLYASRPLWDLVLILLSLGGLASVLTSLVPGWRRLRRGRIAPPPTVR